jgi:hypothetical protein
MVKPGTGIPTAELTVPWQQLYVTALERAYGVIRAIERELDKHSSGAPAAAALAAWIGSALEYYDFFIYGAAAALVFGKICFPATDPAAGTLLALATFGVGHVSRPLGGILLGHVGDKLGRKRVLLLSLLLMGLCRAGRLPADLCPGGSACPRCWSCSDCCRGSPRVANGPAPTR